jgi:hypothetical protein
MDYRYADRVLGLLYTPTALVQMAMYGDLKKLAKNRLMQMAFTGASDHCLYLEHDDFDDEFEDGLEVVYLVDPGGEPGAIALEVHVSGENGLYACWQAEVRDGKVGEWSVNHCY